MDFVGRCPFPTLLLVCTEATTKDEPVARLKVTRGVAVAIECFGAAVTPLPFPLTLFVVATEITTSPEGSTWSELVSSEDEVSTPLGRGVVEVVLVVDVLL